MGYYMAGDYYAAGGIFSFIGKGLKTVGGFLPGPLGGAATAIGGALDPSKKAASSPVPMTIPSAIPTIINRSGGTIQPKPGLTGMAERLIPGGSSGYEFVPRKRRRLNVANPKALRRAIRRQAGFVKLARRALKGTGYTIASRGSRRGRVSISEHGPGSVTVRGR